MTQDKPTKDTVSTTTKEDLFKPISLEEMLESLKKLKEVAGEPMALIMIPSFKGFDCFKVKVSYVKKMFFGESFIFNKGGE